MTDAFRPWLERTLNPGRQTRVLFIMLNPSIADHVNDDPTIRRCKGFANALQAGAMGVANLFDRRATDPSHIGHFSSIEELLSPEADFAIRKAIVMAGRPEDRIICGWGAIHRTWPERTLDFRQRRIDLVCHIAMELGRDLYALHRTADGSPGHPLYLPSAARPFIWQAADGDSP